MGVKVTPIYKCSLCGAMYDENHTVAQCQKQELANRTAASLADRKIVRDE